MSYRLFFRRFLLTCITLFLLWLAWEELAGDVLQFSYSRTFGQQVETFTQLGCGILSLLTIFTCFWWQKWASPIRVAWAISLVSVAGLSSLVWGPPMLLNALFFVVAALLLSLTTIWGLRRLVVYVSNTAEQPK